MIWCMWPIPLFIYMSGLKSSITYYYVYGGKVADADLKANAKDIVNAFDRHEVVNLKKMSFSIKIS